MSELEKAYYEALELMPKAFTSNQFAVELRKKGVPKNITSTKGRIGEFLETKCIRSKFASRHWYKKN